MGTALPRLCPPYKHRHCERSEAIHGAASGDMDCFVATLLAMTAEIYLAAFHAFTSPPNSTTSGSRMFDGVREKRGAGAGWVTP